MRLVVCLTLACSSVLTASGQAVAAGAAPAAKNVAATSLYRADLTWVVKTTVTLAVEDADSTSWTFSLVQPQKLNEGTGSRFICADPKTGTGNVLGAPIEQLVLECQFQPKVDFTGDEVFTYQVTDKEGNTSQPAEIKISVLHGGLRWEFLSRGQTALTSDSTSTTEAIPAIFGSTAQDFLFRLNWVTRNPRAPKNAATRRVGTDTARTADAHLKFETGFVTEAQSATATATDTGESAPALVNQRKFTAGGEFNYNAVFAPDEGGTFVEIGALFRGNLDAAVESASDTATVKSQLVTLVRQGTGAGTFRAETGFRAVLKQYADEPLRTSVTHGGESQFRKNSDNLVEFEFAYQRNTALSGLKVLEISEDRYVIRVAASPELPDIPGHIKLTLGVEMTGGFKAGSPKQFKILYGVNTSTFGLFR